MSDEHPDATVQKPTLIFDGDCSFCRRWVGRWKSLTGDAIDFVPSESAK